MATRALILRPGYFPLFDKGKPISSGYIYIGEPDLDPEIVSNQKAITFLQENGTEVPGSQPVRTSAGGVPTYNGSPVTVLIDGDYSVKVLDKHGSQIYYVPKNADLQDENIVTSVPAIADLRALTGVVDEQRIGVGGSDGGPFVFKAGDQSAAVAIDEVDPGEGNGGVVISPISDKTGASGAFFREYGQAVTVTPVVRAIWYGCSPGQTGAENQKRFQKPLDRLFDVDIDGGEYPVTGNLYAYHFQTIKGQSFKSHLKFTDGGLIYDATRTPVTEPYIWHFSLEQIQISRSGTSGAALQFLGDGNVGPNKGVARGYLRRVQISGSTGYGIDCSDYYIHDWSGIVVQECDTAGVRFGQEGSIGCNAVKIHGGEIQGNNVGVQMDSANGISFFGTSIEGNDSNGVVMTSDTDRNCHNVGFYNCWFESNGSGPGEYDIIVGNSNTNTGYCLKIDNCFFTDGSGGKDSAIQLVKMQAVQMTNNSFKGYAVSGVEMAPASGGAVTGSYAGHFLSSTPAFLDVEDVNFVNLDYADRTIATSVSEDVPNLTSGSSYEFDVSVAGCVRGDFVSWSCGASLQKLQVTAGIPSDGTVRITVFNGTPASVNLSNATWRVVVDKLSSWF